ncbi:MAG: hypothetical protein KAR19_02260 [Bacteroidales bacterium]|nr:hypothetical protein [Bacteroidales bacterium]
MRDNIVHISYDILNSQISDRYIVTLEIRDANNGKIVGGNNKIIRWDLQADSIFNGGRERLKMLSNGVFGGMGIHASFWSSTESQTWTAWRRLLYYDNSQVTRNYYNMDYGFSVRCVMDE